MVIVIIAIMLLEGVCVDTINFTTNIFGILNQLILYEGIPVRLDLTRTTLPTAESVHDFRRASFCLNLRLLYSKFDFVLFFFFFSYQYLSISNTFQHC